MLRWHLREPIPKRVWLGGPLRECFRSVKGIDLPRTRIRVALIPEKGFYSGGFVKEGQLAFHAGRKKVRDVPCVESRLACNRRERNALALGFDDTDCFAIDHEQVITASALERNFGDCDSSPGRKIYCAIRLHLPAAKGELLIDVDSGDLLWKQRHA